MSAYMVDRHHINYLIDAALYCGQKVFRWYHSGRHCELHAGDFDRASEVGQMLWDANRESIVARYPDTRDNFYDNAPGTIGEDYEFAYRPLYRQCDPVQIIKACRCFAYQACEYDGWEDSEAHAFIDSLVVHACSELPGYDEAEWGAPEPQSVRR